MFHRSSPGDDNTSFLPEDYIVRKAERRTNLIALSLFTVVIFGVVAAFFVTHSQWSSVKEQQQSINIRYTKAAQQIEQLKTLESQKEAMLGKAELTTALIEKTPRSLLLADLINRMPDNLALLEFSLESKRLDKKRPVTRSKPKPRSLDGRLSRRVRDGATGPKEEAPPPTAPRFRTRLVLVGVAPDHENVSQYLASLQDSPLLSDVDLKFSQSTVFDNHELVKFRIDAILDPNADARRIEPLTASHAGVFGSSDAVAGADTEEER